MGVKEGLLALLATGPRHGYQLKVEFEAATGDAWPLNVGQVYTTLQRLERDGLVEVDSTDDEGRIAYRATAGGREALASWWRTPVERTVANRDEISMKLLLAMAAGVIDPQAVVDVQRTATMGALQDYTRLRADTDDADVAWHLHLDRLVIRAEAELKWLDRVEARLATGPTPASEGTSQPATVNVPTPGGAP